VTPPQPPAHAAPVDVLSSLQWLADLSDAARQKLLSVSRLRALRRNERAWRSGEDADRVAVAVSGRFKLVRRDDAGREALVDLLGPGELLCPAAACELEQFCCDAVAMEDGSQALVVPRDALHEAVGATTAGALLSCVGKRMAATCRRVDELAGGTVEQRIARLLLRLGEQVGRIDGDGLHVPVRLARQDIADLAGTTIESAIRAMSRLSRQGIVTTLRAGFVVRDRRALQRIASGE
jgi:CRP-like cAMP-binding protein